MYDYHCGSLPPAFDSFYTRVSEVHKYNTRLASKKSYQVPPARTNYAKFSIRFQGPKIWNSLNEELKNNSKKSLKDKLKRSFLDSYI